MYIRLDDVYEVIDIISSFTFEEMVCESCFLKFICSTQKNYSCTLENAIAIFDNDTKEFVRIDGVDEDEEKVILEHLKPYESELGDCIDSINDLYHGINIT